MAMEAGIGVLHRQRMPMTVGSHSPEAEKEACDGLSLRASEGIKPMDTLTLDFRLSTLRESKFLSF